MEDKLILLKRKNPIEFEIHRNEIKQTKNLILTTKDEQLAERIVESYNNYVRDLNKKEKEDSVISEAIDNLKKGIHDRLANYKVRDISIKADINVVGKFANINIKILFDKKYTIKTLEKISVILDEYEDFDIRPIFYDNDTIIASKKISF